jgi:hypothetical protein
MGSLVVLLLAERARSEGARSTRALEDQPGYPGKAPTNELENLIHADLTSGLGNRRLQALDYLGFGFLLSRI